MILLFPVRVFTKICMFDDGFEMDLKRCQREMGVDGSEDGGLMSDVAL